VSIIHDFTAAGLATQLHCGNTQTRTLYSDRTRQALLHNSTAATHKHERCTLTEQRAV